MKDPTSITIRQFTREDLDAVVHINRIALPENYPSDFFLYCFRSCSDGFFVAETPDHEIVGYIMQRLETAISNFGFRLTKKGHIISIAVLPEYRRRNIGSNLIKSSIKILAEKSIKEFYLEVRVSNEPAIKLYDGLGFQKVKVHKRYYQDGESAYRMAVKISDS